MGLAARAYSSKHLSARNPFIIQTLLILLAPIVYAAGIYMFLGRLIRATGYAQLSFTRLSWLSKIFVCGDIFCFLVQAAGAAKLVHPSGANDIKLAQNIILAGLGLQVILFGLFALCAVTFHIRIVSKNLGTTIAPHIRFTTMMLSLYLCSVLVTVRNIYRLLEYSQGQGGYLQVHEWPTYVLDVVLMGLISAITIFWYGAIRRDIPSAESYPLQNHDGEPTSGLYR